MVSEYCSLLDLLRRIPVSDTCIVLVLLFVCFVGARPRSTGFIKSFVLHAYGIVIITIGVGMVSLLAICLFMLSVHM